MAMSTKVLTEHQVNCHIQKNPLGTLCDCGYQAQQDAAIRKRKGLRKLPDYCRPHGRRIIVFMYGIGGCRKCCEGSIDQLKERKAKRGKQ